MRGYIEHGDTLIVGDRVRTQPMALEAGVACLVVTGGARPDDDVLALAREKGCCGGIDGSRHVRRGTARESLSWSR